MGVAEQKDWAGPIKLSIDPRSFFIAANRITDSRYVRISGSLHTTEVEAKNEFNYQQFFDGLSPFQGFLARVNPT